MTSDSKDIRTGKTNDVSAFLKKVAATPVVANGSRNRLLVGIDATASRAQLWDQAMQVQNDMFSEAAKLGGLTIQVAYYQGYGEFHAFAWHQRAEELIKDMRSVTCASGATQIEKLFKHALNEHKQQRIKALVFIGDSFEEEIEPICALAGQLSILGVPAFMFQEGNDPFAESVFRKIAGITHGAYCRFDTNSAQQLRDLLRAVAVFAAGGHKALAKQQDRSGLSAQIYGQLPKL